MPADNTAFRTGGAAKEMIGSHSVFAPSKVMSSMKEFMVCAYSANSGLTKSMESTLPEGSQHLEISTILMHMPGLQGGNIYHISDKIGKV